MKNITSERELTVSTPLPCASGCDFALEGSLCATLDALQVPREGRWRSFVLYMRGLQEYSYLNHTQKKQLCEMLAILLENKDYSEKNYQVLLEQIWKVLVEPYEGRLNAAAQEAKMLAEEFRATILRRKGSVGRVEEASVRAVSSGKGPEEIVTILRETFQELRELMERDAAAMMELVQQDALSGLYNRRAFDLFLQKSIKQWRDSNTPFALLMLDIDYFKKFNDDFGHRIGDQAIQTVANIIKRSVKFFLKNPGEDILVARYGGEEFAVILRGSAVQYADSVAKKIRSNMERFNFIIRNNDGNVIQEGIGITVSIGVAYADDNWKKAFIENMIDAADKALYRAKQAGRNCVYRNRENRYEKIAP